MQTVVLDMRDKMILQIIYNQQVYPDWEKAPFSYDEIRRQIPGIHSNGTISTRINKMRGAGYIVSTSQRTFRSLRLTPKGIAYVKNMMEGGDGTELTL